MEQNRRDGRAVAGSGRSHWAQFTSNLLLAAVVRRDFGQTGRAEVVVEWVKDEEKRKKILAAAVATTIASAVVTVPI
jgi:hypothetical protein